MIRSASASAITRASASKAARAGEGSPESLGMATRGAGGRAMGYFTLSNVIAATHGFASQAPGPWIEAQREQKLSTGHPQPISSPA